MQSEIQELLHRLTENKFSDADWQQLNKLLGDDKQKDKILLAIQEVIENTKQSEAFDEQRYVPLLKKVLDADKSSFGSVKSIINWRKIAVAASILLFVGIGGYFILSNRDNKKVEVAKIIKGDVEAPKRAIPTITVANGTNILLDSAASGTLTSQGNVNLIKTADGQIEYNSIGRADNSTPIYNTLTNPRGSKVVEMILADGSHVWLNAGSSVTYPVSFSGKTRDVSMTGEAYFEVARNEKMPFHVKVNGIAVEVLGTHFNINAYAGEAAIKATLLEGSIKIINGRDSVFISPGQQAQVSNRIKVINDADLDEVMAWQKGLFIFNNADVQTIMRQVSNWYDMDITYEGNIKKETFSGIVNRYENISQVLKIMEEAGIRYRIEGRKLIITYY